MRETNQPFQPEFFYQIMFLLSMFVFAFTMVFFYGVPANADVYKYTDKSGDVVFTDDLSKVPKNQRESALVIEEGEKDAETEEKSIEPVKEEKETGQKPGSKSVSEKKQARQQLVKQKADLKTESERLKAQRKELEKMKQSIQTREDRKEFKEKLKEYNRRIEAHNEKQQRLHEKIEEFNQSLAD